MPRTKNYLRTNRKKWALSQTELGALLGVSRSAISKYEQNLVRLPIRRFIACEIIFGVPGGDLLATLREQVEDVLARRMLTLHDRLEGKKDRASRRKLTLLSQATERMQAVRYEL